MVEISVIESSCVSSVMKLDSSNQKESTISADCASCAYVDDALTLIVLPFAPTNVTKLPPVILTLTLLPTVESLCVKVNQAACIGTVNRIITSAAVNCILRTSAANRYLICTSAAA